MHSRSQTTTRATGPLHAALAPIPPAGSDDDVVSLDDSLHASDDPSLMELPNGSNWIDQHTVSRIPALAEPLSQSVACAASPPPPPSSPPPPPGATSSSCSDPSEMPLGPDVATCASGDDAAAHVAHSLAIALGQPAPNCPSADGQSNDDQAIAIPGHGYGDSETTRPPRPDPRPTHTLPSQTFVHRARATQLMEVEERSTKRKRCVSKFPIASEFSAPASNGKASVPPRCKRIKSTPLTARHQLEELFHLSREDAAARVGCGLTHFKQRCRALGVLKWPRRQVRALLDAQGRLERHQQTRLLGSGRCNRDCVHTDKALCQVSLWLTQTKAQSDSLRHGIPGHPQRLHKLPVSLHRFTRAAIESDSGVCIPRGI